MTVSYFRDKICLITGSARGIGLATARELGRGGAKIVLSDVIGDALLESAKSLSDAGVDVLARRCDVTDPEDCEALVAAAAERFGKLDICVNNAGISIVDYFENLKPETAKKLVDVNIMGSVYMSIAALEEIRKSRGHLIFVASVGGIRTPPTSCMYGASKAFLRSFAEAVRLELKPDGVHVGVISPGFTTTDSAKSVLKGDGTLRPIDRPPHDTPEGTAKAIAKLIENRERERVTTAMGKATLVLQRLSPTMLDWYLTGRELKN